MHTGTDYWKNYMERYFGSGHITDWQKSCREVTIRSNDEPLHLETYIYGDKKPTFIFSHGIVGYARLLLPFVLPLYHRGINVICPDLKGYGYNSHTRGDFSWDEHVTNLVDTARYARERFSGPLFIGGASMGGPLAYEAAVRFRQIDGLICWGLWNMTDGEFIENETSLKGKSRIVLPLLKLTKGLVERAAGTRMLRIDSVVSYDTLSGVPECNEMIRNDPQAGNFISVRGALSLLTQSRPSVAYENFLKPVLIFQGGADRMTPPQYTNETFLRIGCPDKRYIELDGAEHFPLQKRFYDEWCSKVSAFIRMNG